MLFAINNVQVVLLVVSVLVIGVGVLLSVRHWRWSAAIEAYGRPIEAYPSLVVADTTYHELLSLGLGVCAFCSMTLFDSRLVHYWRILVPPERLQEVLEQLRRHEVRVIDCFADSRVEEAIACCLHDKAFYDEHCCVCGGLRENQESILCQTCRLLLPDEKENRS